MLKISLSIILFLFSTISIAQSITFTAIPDEDESRLRSRFDKVATYLSKELGVEVKYIPVKSYAAAITAFRNNEVQLAWFGGLSGVKARMLVPNSLAIAQGYEDQFFTSYFIAHHSTGLKPNEDFPVGFDGKTFTFGSKGSTSGRLMPEYFIQEHTKKSPKQLFKRVGFSGDHSRTISQVQAGAYELGVVNYKVWENELAAGKVDLSKVSVIWKTPTYPDYQWTLRADLSDKLKNKLTQALLNMKDEALLASFPRKSFVPASNADYQPIEEVAKKIGLID